MRIVRMSYQNRQCMMQRRSCILKQHHRPMNPAISGSSVVCSTRDPLRSSRCDCCVLQCSKTGCDLKSGQARERCFVLTGVGRFNCGATARLSGVALRAVTAHVKHEWAPGPSLVAILIETTFVSFQSKLQASTFFICMSNHCNCSSVIAVQPSEKEAARWRGLWLAHAKSLL